MTQPDLFPPVSADDLAALRSTLGLYGWQTRADLVKRLGWSERKIRDVAEALGADVIRCQAGFRLTQDITRESGDLDLALQAADAAESQGKKMLAYSLGLRRRLHALIAH